MFYCAVLGASRYSADPFVAVDDSGVIAILYCAVGDITDNAAR